MKLAIACSTPKLEDGRDRAPARADQERPGPDLADTM